MKNVNLLATLLLGAVWSIGATAQQEVEEESSYGLNLVIVIMNQNHSFHIERAARLEQQVMEQAKHFKMTGSIKVVKLNPDLGDIAGGWTVLPLAKRLTESFTRANWFMFVYEGTAIYLDKLRKELGKFRPPTKPIFLGRALQDRRPSILHNYAMDEGADHGPLDYPDFTSSFLMTRSLLRGLLPKEDNSNPGLPAIETVDVFYELAKLVKEKFKGNVQLQNVDALCGVRWRDEGPDAVDDCATDFNYDDWLSNDALNESKICYAINTFQGNHATRLSKLKDTWINSTKSSVRFYSDVEDQALGTTLADSAIPNVPHGHCKKVASMMRHYLDEDAERCQWLVVAQDDTMINPQRMAGLLHRYSREGQQQRPRLGDDGVLHHDLVHDVQQMAIGDRTGTNHWQSAFLEPRDPMFPSSYDYLDAGAGIAFSRLAVRILVEHLDRCYCGLHENAGQMLGFCMNRFQIPMLSDPHFHKAAPIAYPFSTLKHQRPVTFHSFKGIDAQSIYDYYIQPTFPKKYIRQFSKDGEEVEPEIDELQAGFHRDPTLDNFSEEHPDTEWEHLEHLEGEEGEEFPESFDHEPPEAQTEPPVEFRHEEL